MTNPTNVFFSNGVLTDSNGFERVRFPANTIEEALANVAAQTATLSNALIRDGALTATNLRVGNGAISGTFASANKPRSENLDIHPRHGGTMPEDILAAAHLLANWMRANKCESYYGLTLDRDAYGSKPRFEGDKTAIDVYAEQQKRKMYDYERNRQGASLSGDYMIVDDPWARSPYDPMPVPRRMEPPPPANTTVSLPHRWGQPDRNGVVTCRSCYSFASLRHPLPATGCSGMTPQQMREASGQPSQAPVTRAVPAPRPYVHGGHQWLFMQDSLDFRCTLCHAVAQNPDRESIAPCRGETTR